MHFYSLDVLRGVAALSVVLWHWQHFFLPLNKLGGEFFLDKQPLFEILAIFYRYGSAAVQLFFCLSGFIFFWLYSKRIADRTVSFKYFSILRLSRLYPLHFITLLLVAFGQLVYASITKTSFVYQFNDLYHFLLNVLFMSSWGIEKGFSFNAPIWSVSVEILLYIFFFGFCRIFKQNILALVSLVIIGFFVQRLNSAIGSGVMCFFIGGILFAACEKIIKAGDPWKITVWLPYLTIIAWSATIITLRFNHESTFGELPCVLATIISNWAVIVLLPLSILSLALVEAKRGTLGKRLSFIGDISYSSYLLHFPLQLAIAVVTAKLPIDQSVFYSPWFMLLFFFILIILSLVSHHFFEIPMQRILRRQLSGSRVRIAVVN